MTSNNRSKINQLINNWPRGTIRTVSYLKNQGFSYNLLSSYKKHQWLDSIGNGAYKHDSDAVDWFGGVYAIQNQMGLTIHPGGKTALELKGYSHYLPDTRKKGYLFGMRGEKLPAWFKKYDWGIKIFFQAVRLFPKDFDFGYINWSNKEFNIKISAPERAALEMLNNIPKFHTFDECYYIFENLVSLRPKICQELLENCNSIKVKRIFLFMSDSLEHQWLKDLNLEKMDLGKGPRLIVRNGILDSKYHITVPKEYKK